MRPLEKVSESNTDRIYLWWNLNNDALITKGSLDRRAYLIYGSFIFMTVFTIVWGALKSLECLKRNDGVLYKKMTMEEAVLYPIQITCFLYIIIENVSNVLVNLLYTGVFFFKAMSAMTCLLSISDIRKQRFSTYDNTCVILCSMVFGWYILNKHWIAHNLIGIAYSICRIERFHFNNFETGCIILGGMLIYDVFWVFGMNVMDIVATSISSPVELVFPVDLLEKGLGAENFAMLGLGNIVLPGKFIALFLRFDNWLSRDSRAYFNVSILGYIFGLLTAFVVKHKYGHVQPALLYLVPACVGAPLFLALINGDIEAMLQYDDYQCNGKETSNKHTHAAAARRLKSSGGAGDSKS